MSEMKKFNLTFGNKILESNEDLAYLIVIVFDSILGIVGNIFIIGAICCSKELHTTLNVLIFNLALSDLCISFLVDPFIPFGIIFGPSFFVQRKVLCSFIATMTVVACIASLISMFLLALNRYLFICHRVIYKKCVKWNTSIYLCIATWILGILGDLPNYIGLGGHYFDLKSLNCTWNRLASRAYTLILMAVTILIPSLFIFFFYLKIFIFAYKAKTRTTQQSIKRRQNFKNSLSIAKGLFFSFFIFALCWLPYALLIIIDSKDEISKFFYTCSIQLATLNSSLNPLLYAFTNTQFKRGYSNFLNYLFNRKKYRYCSRLNNSTSNEKKSYQKNCIPSASAGNEISIKESKETAL